MSTRDRFDMTAPPPPPPKHIGLKIALFVLFLILAAGGIAGYMAWSYLSTPMRAQGKDIEIVIEPGQSFQALSQNLVQLGCIPDEDRFALLAHYKKLAGKVQTGRFLLNTGWTPVQVLDQITSGKPILERVTIPEGLTWWEVGKRLEAAGMVRFDDFKKVVHDSEFLRHWGIPYATAEGFLFPDTYLIMRPLKLNYESARSVVGRLIDTFWRRTSPIWPDGRRPGPGHADMVRRLVTLASIVEKETSVADERARVAGVYSNRLRIKMPLQADPTIIYGIGPTFNGDIKRSDLNNEANRYNTYKHPGLPPGPIASPGLACLRAAAKPEEHDLIYFVARGDGSHVFSTNLKDHNAAVRLYRAAIRKGDSPELLPGRGSE